MQYFNVDNVQRTVGRHLRCSEPHLSYGLEIVANLLEAIRINGIYAYAYSGQRSVRLCVYGQGVGAYLAYELSRDLSEGVLQTAHLIVADAVDPTVGDTIFMR